MSNVLAIEIVDLVKRYSSGSRSLTSATELRKFLSILKGPRDHSVVALDDVNLTIPKGEVFGLLGPNGAGKTTLIKILSTLVLPDSGRALVHGINVVRHPRRVVRILQSVLAEGVGFERRLSGRQNLEFYATLYGVPPTLARQRIESLLDFCGLMNQADMMFQRYSTGMARRLLVCRALLSDASVLLFDEPTAGLDPISAAGFRELMKDVLAKERGKTILLTTHNLWEAQQICDRIAVMSKGKILMTGAPDEIRRVVADRVTVSLLLTNCRDGSGEGVVQKIQQVDGVVGWELLDDDHNQTIKLQIEGTKDINYNNLFQGLSALGLRISALEASQPSLEEAFIKLTAEVKG